MFLRFRGYAHGCCAQWSFWWGHDKLECFAKSSPWQILPSCIANGVNFARFCHGAWQNLARTHLPRFNCRAPQESFIHNGTLNKTRNETLNKILNEILHETLDETERKSRGLLLGFLYLHVEVPAPAAVKAGLGPEHPDKATMLLML